MVSLDKWQAGNLRCSTANLFLVLCKYRFFYGDFVSILRQLCNYVYRCYYLKPVPINFCSYSCDYYPLRS